MTLYNGQTGNFVSMRMRVRYTTSSTGLSRIRQHQEKIKPDTVVKQVHEQIIGQRLSTVGEDPVLGLSEIGVHEAHAANHHCHLRRRQRQQLRPVHQQLLSRNGVFGLLVVTEAIREASVRCAWFRNQDRRFLLRFNVEW